MKKELTKEMTDAACKELGVDPATNPKGGGVPFGERIKRARTRWLDDKLWRLA